jgi:hypothetical protein
MFKQSTVRSFSIVAIILSLIGLLISVLGTIFLTHTQFGLTFFLGIVSWAFLLWASIIGYQLCNSYKLYDDEYKKVGIRIYLIIVAFVLFLFVGLVIGLALSVILLGALWALKRNYDEWEENNTPYIPEEPAASASITNDTANSI